MTKRVCIIGAGPSGLTAIKTCLEEGLEPICYEKTKNFGGLWRFRNNDEEGVASVMKTTIINSSKEMSSYSDFPPEDKLPNYMHNTKVIDYLDAYCKAFNLRKYVKYNQNIHTISYAPDYDVSGQWLIRVQEKDKEPRDEIFDFVLVCIGHHVYPNIPDFPGLNDFKGTAFHTHSYKETTGLEDKNILVVGIGNSGLDASVELSRVGKITYLSTRRGAWISQRISTNGYPFDVTLLSRFNSNLLNIMPWSASNAIFEAYLNNHFDHAHYNLKPKHRSFEQHVTINDEFPNRIASGTLVIKNDVHHFTEDGVVFKGEDKEYPIDVAIFATGYDIKFPILSDGIIGSIKDNEVALYKNVFPTSLHHPTLAIIGLVQPLGSILPVSEMQCRWATRVFKGDCQLPSYQRMQTDIEKYREYLKKYFVNTQRHTIQVNYIDYMDSIAELIGVKPKLLKIFLTDPQLFMTIYFGPCYPYQYRLNGPHSWSGATNAILTGKNRILAPLQTRKEEKKPTKVKSTFLLMRIFYIFLFFLCSVIYYFQTYFI